MGVDNQVFLSQFFKFFIILINIKIVLFKR
jgi:hypothetical protein